MNDTCKYSLLTDPLISVRRPGGARLQIDLPAVLAGLAKDEIVSFEALQPHQRQAWFCFLVQLAAIALDRSGREEPCRNAEQWRELLMGLTDGDEAAWCLVVEDVSRPAFMQSPVPEGSLDEAGYKADVATPDELDMLVLSKDHDVKKHRTARPATEHWLYALLTLQTLEGYSGSRNYGIIRMNGGYGSRPLLGLAPALGWGTRFRRDVPAVLSARERLVRERNYDPQGPALLWRLPWDGAKSSRIPLAQCHPLFIEVCRRIRFRRRHAGLECWRATTEAARIAAPEDINGATGDPWTPVDKAENKALSVGSSGFGYDLLRRILLTGDFEWPAAMERTPAEEGGAYLLARALARGQGKTEGLHRRVVPVPEKALGRISDTSRREELAERAEERVDTAAKVQRNVLYPALAALLTAGHEAKVDSAQVRRWTDAFDAAVDEAFFPELWASLGVPREEARRRWQEKLKKFAEQQLQDAIQSAPVPSIHRYRAVSAAQAIFYGRARQHLTALHPSTEEAEHEPAESS